VSVNFTGSSIRLATTIAAVTTEARNGNEAGRAGSSHKAKRPRRAELHYRSAATEKPVLSGSSYCWFLADRIIE